MHVLVLAVYCTVTTAYTLGEKENQMKKINEKKKSKPPTKTQVSYRKLSEMAPSEERKREGMKTA